MQETRCEVYVHKLKGRKGDLTHTHTHPGYLQVLNTAGNVVPHVYCIGDANGKYMLAHAASAQGISAVENMCARPHVLNHLSIPAACFTHPEVSFVGVTQVRQGGGVISIHHTGH